MNSSTFLLLLRSDGPNSPIGEILVLDERPTEMMSAADQTNLGQYSRWVLAWIDAAGQPVPSQHFLVDLDQTMVTLVADRVEIFESGRNDRLELPAGGTVEEMAIAAELEPVLSQLEQMELTDRPLTSGERHLLESKTWGDRPSIAQLRDLGRDLAELAETGMSPPDDLEFTPTAYLPSEIRVIAQAANLTADQVYRL